MIKTLNDSWSREVYLPLDCTVIYASVMLKEVSERCEGGT